MRCLVVICPAMLREKWRDELRNRFGVVARIVDAKDFQDELANSDHSGDGKAWILSYQAARPPKEWSPTAKKPVRLSTRWQLADYLHSNADSEPIIDMVIFDEAHYMRNTETASWQLADLLRDVSAYQLMLSATPINLKNEDLFNLLRLLDPDHFSSLDDFQRMIEANKPLVEARDAVLNKSVGVDAILSGWMPSPCTRHSVSHCSSRQFLMIPYGGSSLEGLLPR
ncbi:MAG: DEAD/DEAH box helicase family protein [Betaproteobacteria bacterium]|nr:DEAD/DEAH box helicase family protein [Betaproteobacteria bacterium]